MPPSTKKSDIVYALLSVLVTWVCGAVAMREGASGYPVGILMIGSVAGLPKLFDLAGYLFMYFVLRRR